MKKLVILLVSCGFFTILWGGFFAAPASAFLGDVNADSIIDVGDMVYLIQYFFQNGPPPPNPIDADMDGSPGINLGDLLQLIGYYSYGCPLLTYTGVSVKVGSQIRFSSDLIFPIDTITHSNQDTTYIKIIANGGPDLMGMVIPISYASKPGEVEVTLDRVSFDGGIIPPDWFESGSLDNDISWPIPASINNNNKTVTLVPCANNPTDTPLDSGTVGIVATLYFTKIADGKPLSLTTTETPPSHSFMLISSFCADTLGVVSPSERILTPLLSSNLKGDTNCDGIVDIGDVVYTINYLFKSGPPPCGL